MTDITNQMSEITDPSVLRDDAKLDDLTDFFGHHVKEVITIHTIMFERLLFQEERPTLALAELLEDAANTYMDFAAEISRNQLAQSNEVE